MVERILEETSTDANSGKNILILHIYIIDIYAHSYI